MEENLRAGEGRNRGKDILGLERGTRREGHNWVSKEWKGKGLPKGGAGAR